MLRVKVLKQPLDEQKEICESPRSEEDQSPRSTRYFAQTKGKTTLQKESSIMMS